MRKHIQNFDSASSGRSGYLGKGAAGNRGLRLVISSLALLLLACSALISLTAVNQAHAQSECIILCFPTPTPKPSPTPNPKPSPTPTPKPPPTATATAAPKPSSTPVVRPTPTANESASSLTPVATIAPTEIAPKPVTATLPTAQRSSGTQENNGGVLRVAAISSSIILILLLNLGLGWLFVRRALMPPAPAKLPPSGARPWSRIHVPNPNSLLPAINKVRNMPSPFPRSSARKGIPTPFPTPTVVESVPGDITSDSRSGQHTVVSGSAYTVASTDETPAPRPVRKKRGLIARAPYYSNMAVTDDQKNF